MILGTGIDVVEKDRIKDIKYLDRFAKRILTKQEIVVFDARVDKISFLAKKWAAKEAVSKSFGCGIGGNLSFLDFEILNNSNGQPIVQFTKTYLDTPNFTGNIDEIVVHISISDCKNSAIAQAILEKIII